MPKEYFPRVKEAREALRERAIEVLETYLTIISEARAKGDLETAEKAARWLLEHMPNEAGERLIDSSASKPTVETQSQSSLPTINIGFQLGGVKQQKALPEVVDVTPVKPKSLKP